jgi:hypothetical protein
MAALSALAIGTLFPYAVLIGPAGMGAAADAWQTGIGFVPAATAVAFMIASMALQVWPEVARGRRSWWRALGSW